MRIQALILLLLLGCSQQQNRTPEALRAEAQKAIKTGDSESAIQALSALIKLNGQDIEALIGRASVRLITGDASGAKEDFDAVIKIDPEKGEKAKFFIADRAIWRARYLDMEKHYEQSLKIYNALLTLYPKSGTAYHGRGGLKTSMKDYEGAIDDLTKAIEFDDGNNSAGDSYTLRVRAKKAKGDASGAIEDEAKAKQVFDALSSRNKAEPGRSTE